jgi:hypothetical protein
MLGRRRLPGWLLTAFLLLAWLGAYEVGPELVRPWAARGIVQVTSRPIGEAVSLLTWSTLALLPRFVLYSVPAIAAVRDLRRDGRAQPTWLEWTAVGLAAALFLIAEPTELVRNASMLRSTGSWVPETLVRVTTLLAAVILGLFLCRIGNVGGRRHAGRSDGHREQVQE